MSIDATGNNGIEIGINASFINDRCNSLKEEEQSFNLVIQTLDEALVMPFNLCYKEARTFCGRVFPSIPPFLLTNSHSKTRKPQALRVLLDIGSDGDLLFVHEGTKTYIPFKERYAPQSGVLPMVFLQSSR